MVHSRAVPTSSITVRNQTVDKEWESRGEFWWSERTNGEPIPYLRIWRNRSVSGPLSRPCRHVALLLRERLTLLDEQAREGVPQVVDAAVPEFSLVEDAG